MPNSADFGLSAEPSPGLSPSIDALPTPEANEAPSKLKAEFESPEFQRELANFIKLIGDIRSKLPDPASQALDN